MTLILLGVTLVLTGLFATLGDLRALGVALIAVLLARLSQASDHHRETHPAAPRQTP